MVAWLICAALLSLISILAIVQPGLPNTADTLVHLWRSLEARELLANGVFYPRWAPDFYGGYGYPFFNFYAPGAHLLAALMALAGLGVVRGLAAVQVLALLLYPTGAFLAARAFYAAGRAPRLASPAALLSAALYLYAPLRCRELFIQGNVSQLLALGVLPWCAWTLTESVRRSSLRWATAAGVCLAALVYAHHPSAFLAFPFLAVHAACLALIAGRARSEASFPAISALVCAGCAFLIGLTLSAPFWLPSLVELADVNIGAIETGMFNARLNLTPLRDLLAPAAILDDAALNPPMPHSLGAAQIVLALLGLAAVGVGCGREIASQTSVLSLSKDALAMTARGVFRPVLKDADAIAHAGRDATAHEKLTQRRQDAEAVRRTQQSLAPFAPLREASRAIFRPELTQRRQDAEAARRTQQSLAPFAPLREASRAVFRTALLFSAVAALLILCLALMLPMSAGVWERLPLARFIAFPWRLLGPALLWAALLGGAALSLAPERWQTPALAILLVLIPLSVAPYLFPRPFAPVAEPTVADIIRYELAGGARATASANEYLPRWVRDPDPPPVLAADYLAGRAPQRLDPESLPAGSRWRPVAHGPLEDAWELDLPAAATVRIRRFYFGGWRGWLDGSPAPLAASDPHGLIEVEIPAGAHELRLRFEGTPARTAAGLLALGGLLLAVGLVMWRPRQAGLAPPCSEQPAHDPDRPRNAAEPRRLLIAAAVILLVAGAKTLVIGPHTRWFRHSSPVEAPAAMQHAIHAVFANGIELLGYDLDGQDVRQGDALAVRLYWRPLRPQDADVRPFLHLDAITGETTWANQTKLHAGDKPSSGWPAGFYVVDDYRIEVPAHAPAVVAVLRAGLLNEGGGRVPMADGRDLAALGRVRVRERRPLTAGSVPGREQSYRLGPDLRLVGHAVTMAGTPPRLDVALYWQATAALAEDYTVFLHVLDSAGRMVAQGDGPPLNGWYPTSAWLAGQVIAERRTVTLPAGADLAGLRVAVGLYRPADGVRLPVFDARGARQDADRIILTPAP
jgi:hypothetical protein